MSLVVSDTSPLTNLAAIGRLDLLHSLFGRIQIAEAVWLELNAGGRSWPGRTEVAAADWIVRHGPTNVALLTALSRDLDAGEAAWVDRGGQTLARRFAPPRTLLAQSIGLRAGSRRSPRVSISTPAIEDQAHNRAFHIGQEKTVFVHKFVTLGTLEERIGDMIKEKTALAGAIVGSDESWPAQLDVGWTAAFRA